MHNTIAIRLTYFAYFFYKERHIWIPQSKVYVLEQGSLKNSFCYCLWHFSKVNIILRKQKTKPNPTSPATSCVIRVPRLSPRFLYFEKYVMYLNFYNGKLGFPWTFTIIGFDLWAILFLVTLTKLPFFRLVGMQPLFCGVCTQDTYTGHIPGARTPQV